RLSRRPALLYNVAMCHEKLGRLDRAVDALENYLADAGKVRDRAQVERHIAELKQRRAAEASQPSPEPVVVAPPPSLPLPPPALPPPPPPTPTYKKGWVWGVVVGVVGAVGVGLGLGLGLGLHNTPSATWGSVDLHP